MAKPKDPVMGGTARAELAAACAILDRAGARTGKELRQARKHLAFARDFSTALFLDVERLLILQELGLPAHAPGVSAEDLAPILDVDPRWLREGLLQLTVFGEVRCFRTDGAFLFQHLDHPAPAGATQLSPDEAKALQEKDTVRAPAPPAAQDAPPDHGWPPYDWQRFDEVLAKADADRYALGLLRVMKGFLHALLHPCHCDPPHLQSFVPADMRGDVERCLLGYGEYQARLTRELQALRAQGEALRAEHEALRAQAENAEKQEGVY